MKSVKPRDLRGAFDGTPRLHALHFLLLICMTDPSVPLVRPVSCGRFPWRQLRGLVLRMLVRHVAVIVGHAPSLAALVPCLAASPGTFAKLRTRVGLAAYLVSVAAWAVGRRRSQRALSAGLLGLATSYMLCYSEPRFLDEARHVSGTASVSSQGRY